MTEDDWCDFFDHLVMLVISVVCGLVVWWWWDDRVMVSFCAGASMVCLMNLKPHLLAWVDQKVKGNI